MKYKVTVYLDEAELAEMDKAFGWDYDIEEEPVSGTCDDAPSGFIHEELPYCINWRPLDETE